MSLTQLPQCSQDVFLGFGIDAGKAVIQQEHRAVTNESTGQCGALFLPAGQGDTAFADQRIQSIRKALDGVLERSGLPVQPKQAWTDVATMHAWGVPAFNYGPGQPSQAHQPGEWVEIAKLEECERVIVAELGAA